MYVEYIQLVYNGLYLTMTTRQIKHYNHYYTNSSLDYIYIYTPYGSKHLLKRYG